MDTGTPCPRCGFNMWLLSTTNEWDHYCKPCDVRFNRHCEEMPRPWAETKILSILGKK